MYVTENAMYLMVVTREYWEIAQCNSLKQYL